ncbi:MAG: hypothetical protein IPF98_14990 [Gemmatimonadetes bacterium]|nr:hypothetical protein [Gemmatimonadota bacterium]MCC6770333.1 hypothetical protein [Gemmatimonadaceae bacterium]
MVFLRTLMLAVGIAIGTIMLGWWSVPVVALAYGVALRRSRFPAMTAAASGAIAWGGYLGLAMLGGAPVVRFGRELAASMQLPGWAPFTATLIFPAVLAGLAAYLGARVGGRYLSSP